MNNLLGKTVKNIITGEIGIVRGVKALDINGKPGVFVEVPVITPRGGTYPLMNRVWRIDEIVEAEG